MRVGVVVVADVLVGELAVEYLFRRELGLGETVPGVHILVGVDALPGQELEPLTVWFVLGCDLERLWLV